MAYKITLNTNSAPATSCQYENFNTPPPRIDWRKKGAVTAIGDGSCGAWAFHAVDTVEGIAKIKGSKLYGLPVQEIVDCSGVEDGCRGDFLSNAFDFVKQDGLTIESNHPYNEKMGTCNVKKEAEPVARISSHKYVSADDEDALVKAAANQPVAVSVDANGLDFQFYSSGVFTGPCGTILDHGVTVVGYGTEKGTLKFWIIKNSWGTTWGEKGYMRLQRNITEKDELCVIAMESSFPIV